MFSEDVVGLVEEMGLSPVSTTRVDGWPVFITIMENDDARDDGRAFPLAELTGRVDGR